MAKEDYKPYKPSFSDLADKAINPLRKAGNYMAAAAYSALDPSFNPVADAIDQSRFQFAPESAARPGGVQRPQSTNAFSYEPVGGTTRASALNAARSQSTSQPGRPRVPAPANPSYFSNPAISAYESLGLQPQPLTNLPGTGRAPAQSARNQVDYIGGYPYDIRPGQPNSISGGGRSLGINPGDPNGQRLASSVNTFDMNAANAEYAKANAIRAQAAAGQPRGAGIVLPQQMTGAESALQRVQDLYKQSDFERDPNKRSALLRAARGAEQDLGQVRGVGEGIYRTDAQTQQEAMRTQAQLEAAQLREQGALTRTQMDNVGLEEYRAAAAARDRAAANAPVPFDTTNITAAYGAALDAGIQPYLEDGTLNPQFRGIMSQFIGNDLDRYEAAYGLGGSRQSSVNMAEGGMVPAPAGGSAVGGALGPATPPLPPPGAIQHYQAYATGAQNMGLPPVSFEEFISMGGPTPQSAAGMPKQPMTFADGGPVPDASGAMVTDMDPNAPTDSIPAVIDESQPARLDSGEFVIPKDVVLFFGTDKLQKMIATARDNGAKNGGKSAIA